MNEIIRLILSAKQVGVTSILFEKIIDLIYNLGDRRKEVLSNRLDQIKIENGSNREFVEFIDNILDRI